MNSHAHTLPTTTEAYIYFWGMIIAQIIGSIYLFSGMLVVAYLLSVVTFFSFKSISKHSFSFKEKLGTKLIIAYSGIVFISGCIFAIHFTLSSLKRYFY